MRITFTGSVENAPEGVTLSYSWDFGDDATPATDTKETPSCTYSTTGTKRVTLTVTQGEGDQSRSHTDTLTVTVTSIQTTGPRGANNTEREALKLTFGEAVGEFLIGQIIIKFPDGLTRAIVPYTVNNETNVREMHLTGDHDLANLVLSHINYGCEL